MKALTPLGILAKTSGTLPPWIFNPCASMIRTKNKLSKAHLLGILFGFFHLYETDGVRSKYNILWYLHADMKNEGVGGGGATFLYTTLRKLILDFEKIVTILWLVKTSPQKIGDWSN
jgi:hypothetical protein